jgi:hypothetical protein
MNNLSAQSAVLATCRVPAKSPEVKTGARLLRRPAAQRRQSSGLGQSDHSMISSARKRTSCGIVTPISRAVFKFMANSTLLSNSTGKS